MSDDRVTNFLRAQIAQQTARTATATVFDGPEPDAAAEGLTIGKQLGVPASVVTGAPDVFRKQVAQKNATTALEGAPKTQGWLNDRLNAAISASIHDTITCRFRC